MIDIAIIGAGPAGLSAAINAAARGKTAVVFGRTAQTSAIYKARRVDNHLGMPEISGADMLAAFEGHAKSLGVEIRHSRVLQILDMGGHFSLNADNEPVDARAVILAAGAAKAAKLPGEEKYLGLGVSYCATCDAMLYRGKRVFAYGDCAEADEDVQLLSQVCAEVVYLPKHNTNAAFAANVRVIGGALTEITGGEYAEGVIVDGETIPCDGAFLLKESVPPESLLSGLELDGSYIKVNRLMETNLPGVYACGDCTGWPLQISKAIGEGQIAAQAAARYLS